MFSWVRVAVLGVLAVHVLADECDITDDPTSMLQNFHDRSQGQQDIAPVAATRAATVPVAATRTATVPVASTKAATVPVAATKASTVPVAATKAATVPVAATSAATVPVAATRVATVQPKAPANKTGPVAVVRHPAGAKDTDCLLDSRSMWGTHLQDIKFDSTLKQAFQQISGSINKAVNPHCRHVTIAASLFSEEKLRGRTYKDAEVEEPLPYEGQAGCGIFVVSDWQAKILTNVSKSDSPGGWRLVPFPTDDFLKKISLTHRSNELQRLFNLVKIGVPLFVQKDVKRVTFADVKCNLPGFSRRVEHIGSSKTDIYTFAHPNFWKKALMKEFRETWAHEQTRHEMSPVMNDMERFHKYVGDSYLRQQMELPEIMCMSWERTERNEAVQSFARRWFWYTAHFTMRPQLTWNAALIDCGEGLKVNYMPFMDARIKLIESISGLNSSTGIDIPLKHEIVSA